ncbi:MAG: ferritin family protein [Candidatus Aminicenantes bacterium]|nr:ferritin family protein [Candidatus Aminicenantes bacterium]
MKEIIFKDFDAVVQFAIGREEKAIQAYGKLMNVARTPGIKKLLQELQDEEKNHKKLLQDLGEKKFDPGDIQEVADMKITDYVEDVEPGEDMNFQELLIFAAKKEQKAVELYSGLAERVKSEELIKTFNFLVQQEKTHKLKLEEEYEKHVLEGY